MREPLTLRAKSFAIEAHKDTRYGKLPYDYHLRAVVAALPEDAAPETVAAAWLHDVVEDTDVTLHDIRATFGGKVTRLVDSVTDEPGPNRKARKDGMYKKLAAAPVEARTIKLADRIANMEASIENPDLSAVYRKEFPEFVRRVGVDKENEALVLRLFWLYLDSLEGAK